MIIVTGGAGFIGSNIIKGLNESGINEILLVDDLTESRKKLQNFSSLKIADFIDYRDFLIEIETHENAFPNCTAIFHQGACSTTNEWDGHYLMKNNYDYSKSVLSFCQRRSLQMIYASSASVYGLGLEGFSEDGEADSPINMYAYSKSIFDKYAMKHAQEMSSQVVGLRYFNVYGPNEQHKTGMTSPVYNFSKQIEESGVINIFKGSGEIADGEHRRDFISVDDVVRLNLWFLSHPEYSGVFNCGTGKSETFNAVAANVIRYFGRGDVRYIDFPEMLKGSYQDFTEADLKKLRAIGYDCEFINLETGVERYLSQLFPDNG